MCNDVVNVCVDGYVNGRGRDQRLSIIDHGRRSGGDELVGQGGLMNV